MAIGPEDEISRYFVQLRRETEAGREDPVQRYAHSIFLMLSFGDIEKYDVNSLIGEIGVMTDPVMAKALVEEREALPQDRMYSVRIPDAAYRAGRLFLKKTIGQVRGMVCGRKQDKKMDTSIAALASSLGASLAAQLGIAISVAGGVAALVLVVLMKAGRDTFCEMTDDAALAEVERHATH